MSVREHIQSFYLAAGNYGCYAFCIIKLAKKILEKKGMSPGIINEQEALIYGVEGSFISFNEDDYNSDKNFYVIDPEGFIRFLTGESYVVRFEGPSYCCKKDEYEINFWALNDSNGLRGIGHFCLPGENTLQFSKTVKNGKIYSKRIYKKRV